MLDSINYVMHTLAAKIHISNCLPCILKYVCLVPVVHVYRISTRLIFDIQTMFKISFLGVNFEYPPD